MEDKHMEEKACSSLSSQANSLLISSSLQGTPLTSNIVTQLSDMSDSIITSLSNSELTTAGNMTSHDSIIITNDGIVFPPGSLMISNEDGEHLDENSSLNENLNEENENNEFDIKVESNALKPTSYTQPYKVENNHDDNNPSFTINQSVLQNITDTDSDLQQITFNNGDHITQFHIQMPLSMSDVQNLHEINKNVFISQAALPEDGKEGESIVIQRSNKNSYLAPSNPLDHNDSKTIIVHDDGKHYLSSDSNFTTDDSGNIFVKHEASNTSEHNSTLDRNPVKSESALASVNQANTQLAPDNTAYSQIVYVQVDNVSQQHLIPVSVTNTVDQTAVSDPSKIDASLKDDGKKKRKPRKPRGTKLVNLLPKEVEGTDKLRNLAPRLLSYPLYAGAQASIGNGKTLLKPFDITTMQFVEGGQYFEVLGRCTQCFRFSRTTSYCRAEKNHRDPKSSVCMECEFHGLSTVVCRRKLNHSAPNSQPLNIVINTALQNAEHVKQLCMRNSLPACFAELHSIVIHHADITFVAQKTREDEHTDITSDLLSAIPQNRKATDYARGYLYPYSKEKWEQWLVKFCHQTGTNYRIRTGKRVNKKTDHGLANHNGKITSYRTLETQLYNCALGGKPRKRKLKDGTRKRKERGSKLIGCPAVIHTRLLETELDWRALEITVPKILAHLSCHDPRETPITNETQYVDYNDFLMSQIDADAPIQQVNTELNDPQQQQRLEFVQVINQETDVVQKKPVTVNDLRRNTKNLLVTCASLLDAINNADVLNSLQDSAQDMLSCIIKEAHKQPQAKRAKKKKDETDNTMMEIDQVTPASLEHLRMDILTDVS